MNRFILTFAALSLLLMLNSKTVFAQGVVQTNLPKEARITGIIKDATTAEAIPYASVAIYHAKDSTLVTGALSADNGSFAIGKLPFGKFYIVISFVGYTNQKVKNITLSPDQKTASLGVIKVASSAIALKGVEVVGNAPPVTYEIDKKVINIAQNITAAGGTLAEALQNAPSVQTDVEGNITRAFKRRLVIGIIAAKCKIEFINFIIEGNIRIVFIPGTGGDIDRSAHTLNLLFFRDNIQNTGTSVGIVFC